MDKILIGIQARSNSTRLPEKALKVVGDSSIIHRVIYQCVRAAGWLQQYSPNIHAKAVLLIPEDDPLRRHIENKIEVFEGPEDDVLTRYAMAAEHYDADYIVRITGDCAWIHSKMITQCAREALKRSTDYTSNILVRTFIEGQDTEVLSRRCLQWLDEKITDPFQREHVTIGLLNGIRTDNIPNDFNIHTIIAEYDLSEVKTSVDTQEEYHAACHLFEIMRGKKKYASEKGTISN